jgi:hypothetical protein
MPVVFRFIVVDRVHQQGRLQAMVWCQHSLTQLCCPRVSALTSSPLYKDTVRRKKVGPRIIKKDQLSGRE